MSGRAARGDTIVRHRAAVRRTWRAAGRVAALALAAACANDGPTAAGESGDWSAGTSAHATPVGALVRTFLVHAPPLRRLSSSSLPLPWPLVIVLHGSSGDAGAIEQQSGMDSLADAARFLVAYPNGTGGDFDLYPSDWNAGTCCGGAYRDNVDDLGFILALIKEVSAHVPVDSRRIYVAGFSSGAYMAYHAGCQLSTVIAAIGVVEGSLVDYSCAPTAPVALWAVHGTDDPEVPYTQDAPTPIGAVPSVAADFPPSVQYWIALNGCSTGVITAAATDVSRARFTHCAGADVDFYSILGGTHGWPGGPDDPGAAPPMNEINATVLMWQFFVRHVR